MSHQTGIKGNDELVEFFNRAKSASDIRAFKVSIRDEILLLDGYEKTKENWILDYDRCILKLVKEKQPCYIFYRLDTMGTSSYDWLFISWSPDDAAVKQKMLYASTKASLKKEFGLSFIRNELFASTQSELLIKQAKAVLLSPHEPAHNLRVAAHQRCRPTIGQAKTATPTSTNLTEVRRKPGTAPLGLDDVERLKLSVVYNTDLVYKTALIATPALKFYN